MRSYTVEVGRKTYTIAVKDLVGDQFQVEVDGQEFLVRLQGDEDLPMVSQVPFVPLPSSQRFEQGTKLALFKSPMAGTIIAVAVQAGDLVQQGQTLLTLEAMKMKNYLEAPHTGQIKEVFVQAQQRVSLGEPLLTFEPS